jgi:hypothetical protein
LASPLLVSPLLAQAQVGVSVNIGEPGFFGQINLGNAAPPPVVYAQPVIIQAPPPGPPMAPLYLRVPPEHHKNWGRYCAQYNACGRKVFFVSDDWYRNTYAPQYKREHGHEEHHDDHEHHEDHHDDRDHHEER